jgi:hypothetical protein
MSRNNVHHNEHYDVFLDSLFLILLLLFANKSGYILYVYYTRRKNISFYLIFMFCRVIYFAVPNRS